MTIKAIMVDSVNSTDEKNEWLNKERIANRQEEKRKMRRLLLCHLIMVLTYDKIDGKIQM